MPANELPRRCDGGARARLRRWLVRVGPLVGGAAAALAIAGCARFGFDGAGTRDGDAVVDGGGSDGAADLVADLRDGNTDRPGSDGAPGLAHLWSRSFGSSGAVDSLWVAVDPGGAVFVAGGFRGVVDLGGGALTSAGERDLLLGRFTADGSHLWSQRFGGGGVDSATGIAVAGPGNVAISGTFSGSVDLGGGALTSAGGWDIFVASYAADGTHRWSRRFGGDGDEGASVIAGDASGNVALAGSFREPLSLGGATLAPVGSRDTFVVSFGPDGAYRWSTSAGGSQWVEVGGVAVDGAGWVTIAGGFRGVASFGGGDLTSVGLTDIFVARLAAADGGHLWSRRFGGAGEDEADAVAVDPAGEVTVAGSFSGTVSFGGADLTAAGFDDLFVVGLDSAGQHRWSRGFGGDAGESPVALAVDSSGTVTATGTFGGALSVGGPDLTSAGLGDVFVARYDADGAHLWSQRFGGASGDGGRGVAVAGDGAITVLGVYRDTASFGGSALTTSGRTGLFVAGYTSAGAHRWSRGFSGGGRTAGAAVAVDVSGNVFVTGGFAGTVDLGGGALTSVTTDDDVLLAAYDGDGAPRWSRRYGGATGDYGSGVAVDASGNVYTSGRFSGTINLGGDDLTCAGAWDVYVASYDTAGAHRWSLAFGGPQIEDSQGLAVSASGEVAVTGRFQSTIDVGGEPLTSAGLWDVFLARFGADGTYRWSRGFGGSLDDEGNGVALDGSGNVALAGNFEGVVNAGGEDMTSAGGWDRFLASYDPDGAHRWSRRFGGVDDDTDTFVAADGSGNVFIAGGFRGTTDLGGDALSSAGDSDIFIASYDRDGVHRWSRSWGGSGADQAAGIAVDGHGHIAVSGSFSGAADVGQLLSSAGNTDVFLAVYDADGAHLRSRSLGGVDRDAAFGVAAGAGIVAVCGRFNNLVDLGGGVAHSGVTAGFVAAFAP